MGSPREPLATAMRESSHDQVMALLKKSRFTATEHEARRINFADGHTLNKLAEKLSAKSTQPATLSLQTFAHSGKSTAPNTIISGQQGSAGPGSQLTKSIATMLNEYLASSRTANERSGTVVSHRPSFDSQK